MPANFRDNESNQDFTSRLGGRSCAVRQTQGAIATAYPETEVQLRIVHLMRNSLNLVSWKERKILALNLKQI